MPTLAVNGLTIPILVGSLKRSFEEVGESPRAFDGTIRTNRRYTKRVLEFDLPVLPQLDVLAWVALLRGDGHAWPFDSNLYSSKGLPAVNALATIGATAPVPKYGAGRLSGGGGSTTCATALGPVWTVALWVWSGSVWNHYVVNSSAQKWLNGARNDATSTTFLSVDSAGNFSLATGFYDDVVALPCLTPTSWPPVLYATGRAFPLAPRLEAYGDLFPGSTASAPVLMRAEVGEVEYEPSLQAGAYTATSCKLSVKLREE